LLGNDGDLEYYVKEAGDILNVTSKLKDKKTAKHVLEYIFKQIVNWKKINPDPPMDL
jgi:intraflagellar transport protein 52